MGSWNTASMEILYHIFGWISFFSWSLSFYPQIVLNYRRKSVVGLNFDYVVLNFAKHTSYLIYNASMFFSPTIQKQYHDEYGSDELIPVAANDVAFSMHAVLLIAFTLFQITIYDRGTQKVSKPCIGIVSVACTIAFICFVIAYPKHSWLWLTSVFGTIQVIMTAIKYTPQVLLNYKRKSTIGWSIDNITLDLAGGILTFAQMGVQSIDQGSFVNFYGNIGKALLSLETIVFDLIFFVQHYVLYPSDSEEDSRTIIQETIEPLLKPTDDSH